MDANLIDSYEMEMVKDLAEKIGIHKLYAIVREIRGEDDDNQRLIEKLKTNEQWLRLENEGLKGEVKALSFALRCNGVSGSRVEYEID